MRIAVVGSGVVGLTTALELQSEYRNAQITILADKFYKDTTSYVAAGIFRPGLRDFSIKSCKIS
jgi:D-aspartate oxidase